MTLVSLKELATSDGILIRVYNINTTKCLYTLSEHTHFVYDLKLMDDGETLLSGGLDKQLIKWSLKTY